MQKSRLLDHTEIKLSNLKAHIAEVENEEFAHDGGQIALSILSRAVDEFLIDITRLREVQNPERKSVVALCEEVNSFIVKYLPVIGIVRRCTEVLNSFEFFDPLIRLSKQLLEDGSGERSNLILYSEWEFSPMIFPMSFQRLPNFLFIGLPVSEASNTLSIPLSGHEIGHAVWRKYGVVNRIAWVEKIERIYNANKGAFKTTFGEDFNIASLDTAHWLHSLKYAQAQAEEVFCDAIGVILFRSAFLQSMEYLLAPSWGGFRSFEYPSNNKRAEFLILFAQKLGCLVPDGFSGMFKPSVPQTLDQRDQFVMDRADELVEQIAAEVFDLALNIVQQQKASLPDEIEIAEIIKYFTHGTPANGRYSLGSIICAAWRCRLSEHPPSLDLLSEIVLKTIEISEINERVGK